MTICMVCELVFCGGEEKSDYPATIASVDGVKVVSNPDYPRDGTFRYDLEEDLSIGGDTEDEDYIFHKPFDAKIAFDGKIFVLDRGDSTFKIYDSEGAYIITIGGRGQAPGEFAQLIFFALSKILLDNPDIFAYYVHISWTYVQINEQQHLFYPTTHPLRRIRLRDAHVRSVRVPQAERQDHEASGKRKCRSYQEGIVLLRQHTAEAAPLAGVSGKSDLWAVLCQSRVCVGFSRLDSGACRDADIGHNPAFS